MEAFEPKKIFSVSDIEKFGYCPLSWWLSENSHEIEENDKLKKGIESHQSIGKDIEEIKIMEEAMTQSERSILMFSIVSIIVAINGAAIIYQIYAPSYQGDALSVILSISAILWVMVASVFFFLGVRNELKLKVLRREQKVQVEQDLKIQKILNQFENLRKRTKLIKDTKMTTILFLIVSAILGLHGFLIVFQPLPQMFSILFLVLALIWLIGSCFLFYLALRTEPSTERDKKKLSMKERLKRSLNESEVSVMLFSVIATILATNSLMIYQDPDSDIGRIFVIMALLWLYGGFLFLYESVRANMGVKPLIRNEIRLMRTIREPDASYRAALRKAIEQIDISEHERGSLWFALVAVMLAINAAIINYSTRIEELYGSVLAHTLEVIALLWLIGALFFLYLMLRYSQATSKLRTAHGIKEGAVEYVDTLDEKEEVLTSEKHGIRGRPDYILKKGEDHIPIEAKTGRVPKGPLFSHILQIAAYCLLVEGTYGRKPPYGIIRYNEIQHEIKYSDELKNTLLTILVKMREILKTKDAHRNHNRPGKCKGCSRRDICPEKLA